MRKRRPSIAPDWSLHQMQEFKYQLLSRTFQNCCSPENKYIALHKTCLLLNCLCFIVTFTVHKFFTVRNLNNGNLGEKSVYIYLAVFEGVPCLLKITLQCSADKKLGNHCFIRTIWCSVPFIWCRNGVPWSQHWDYVIVETVKFSAALTRTRPKKLMCKKIVLNPNSFRSYNSTLRRLKNWVRFPQTHDSPTKRTFESFCYLIHEILFMKKRSVMRVVCSSSSVLVDVPLNFCRYQTSAMW